ncbi:breast cancer type 1 susceptibility protein [Liasis olivaceus]
MDSPVPSVAEVHGILLALQKNLECPICLEVMKEPVSTNCAHIFCRFCVFKLLKQKKGVTQCPLCNAKVTKRSLREDVRFKEVIKGVLETIHAFEYDTGLKFSDELCYPKKGIETVSASSPWKEQLIVNSKGYRDRWKCMKKEEKRKTDLGDGSILPQYNGTETRYSLRKKKKSSKIVFEIGSDSSEDVFQKGSTVRCMDFGSTSLSQVDEGCIGNQSQSPCYIEYPEPSANNGASLNILDMCEDLEGRKLGGTNDTQTVTENLEIVEENMTVKKKQDIPFLDTCMEQPNMDHGFSYIQDHSSSSLCRIAQVQLVGETMKMTTNEQTDDDAEKNGIVQSAGNTLIVCENKEQQLQSQTMPDSPLSERSGKKLMQSIKKVNEWFSKSKEILSPSSLLDVCSEELDQDADPDMSDADSCISQKTEQMENQGEFTNMGEDERPLSKLAASKIVDKIFGRTYKRERKVTPPRNDNGTIQIQAEEIAALNTHSCNTSMRKIFTRKRKATSDVTPKDFNKRQNVKASNKKSAEEKEDPSLENSDQAFDIVDKSPAEQTEADFSVTLCVEEGVSMLKADGGKQAQSECHTLPELNLTNMKNKSNLNKRSKELMKPLGKLQVLRNRSPMLSEKTKTDLDSKELKEVSPGQMQVRWSRRLQLLTGETRRQSEPTKRKRNVDEREQKQPFSFSGRMPSSSVAEDDSYVLQDNLQKAKSWSDASMIDKLYLCDTDMTYANHENSSHVIGTVKDILNTEQTVDSHSADSQGRSSLLQIHPGEVEQAASKDEQFIVVGQPEKHVVCSQLIQGDGICTDKSLETNSKAIGTWELNPETDDSELDTGFMQNIFGCCKRQSFLLHASQVKELAVNSKYLQELSPDKVKDDKDGTHEEKCDAVSCELNKNISIQTPTSCTPSFSEHKNRAEYLQLASPVPFLDCPSISVQSIARNGEGGSQPESKEPIGEERQSPVLERETESPDDSNGSLNVWKNSNLHDTNLSHINGRSSSSVQFQKAESKGTENKRLELSPQTELMQQHSLTCLPLLPGFIHAEKKKNLMEEKQLNSGTEEAVDVSSTGGVKSLIPRPNLEFCTEEEHHHSELLSETPDNLLDPSTKNKEGSPNLWDISDISAMPAKTDKQATNGTDLDSRNKCSFVLKSQDFVFTRRKLLQKLPSSEEEDSSGDEKLPCFQALINMQSTLAQSVKEKETPAEMLASKSSSESCLIHKEEVICPSQESECSVNLFSSQSNVSVDSGKPYNSRDIIPVSNSRENLPSLSGNKKDSSHSEEVPRDTRQLKYGQEECALSESNLGEETMSYASEATHLEDSLGLLSQSEILTTQQRDAMQNNLKKLQQKMAIIEAVLKQGSQSPGPERWPQEGEETDFNREQTGARKGMHTIWEESVSPLTHTTYYSTRKRNRKSPLLTRAKKMSLVASGLNQSELRLVLRFAKKTESTWSDKTTEETTHVIMKTDEDLVCERTLKYFIGIAAQKWVLSYQWIIQSLKAGRVLKEEDFEVRGDVINGRNHQGPKRARESPARKLFQGLEICCYGPFTDMLPEQLKWIVELCGASLVKQPHLFTHATNSTAVIVVQPDAWKEESTCQELPLQCSVAVVSREWVLDSVACYQRQSFDEYIIQQV